MSATRSRKEEKAYLTYLKKVPKGTCIFCASYQQELIQEFASFKVIRNIFSYSIWDGQRVQDHLLVVPKTHTASLAGMDGETLQELHRILADYEQQGYNIYARAPSSKMKSIVHQHTHLIKPEGIIKKFILLSRRPYIRFIA